MRFFVRDILYNRKQRHRLLNHDFSLITSDCSGGRVAKDLKVRMNLLTCNFYFNAEDYIKFFEKIRLLFIITARAVFWEEYRVSYGLSRRFKAVFCSLSKC